MSTRIVEDRELALRVGFESTKWRTAVSFDAYKASLESWDVRLIQRDDHPVGALFLKDGEVHLSIRQEWRRTWLTKGVAKEILNQTTRTRLVDGQDGMRVILGRLGFVELPGAVFVKRVGHEHQLSR